MHEGRFSADRFEQLSAGMVTKAISHVSAAFRSHGRLNPTLDDDGQLSILLHRQYRGYKNLDPSEQPQKAITASILQKMCKLAGSAHINRAMSQLVIGAFFFAMCSCEYCKTQGTCRTKLLTLRNLRFFSGKRELSHYDPYLSLADSVSITFEYQKRDQRGDTITQHHMGDLILCPVHQWAAITQCVLSYPGTTSSSTVNTIINKNGKLALIDSKMLLDKLRAAATAIGINELGFIMEDIGLHSLRSGTAMAMYLSSIPVFTIMLISRWSSDAFL